VNGPRLGGLQRMTCPFRIGPQVQRQCPVWNTSRFGVMTDNRALPPKLVDQVKGSFPSTVA